MNQTFEERFRKFVVEVIRAEVHRAVAEATQADSFLSTVAAAELADVAPATIRRWVKTGRLTRHEAGREIRVSRLELIQLLKSGAAKNDELSPEELAAKMFG